MCRLHVLSLPRNREAVLRTAGAGVSWRASLVPYTQDTGPLTCQGASRGRNQDASLWLLHGRASSGSSPASWQNYRDVVKTTEAQARAREEQRKGRPGVSRQPCLDPHGPHGQRREAKRMSVPAGRLGSIQNTRGGSLGAAAVPCHSRAALVSPLCPFWCGACSSQGAGTMTRSSFRCRRRRYAV